MKKEESTTEQELLLAIQKMINEHETSMLKSICRLINKVVFPDILTAQETQRRQFECIIRILEENGMCEVETDKKGHICSITTKKVLSNG